MIFVRSLEGDYITNEVISWLKYLGSNFCRFNKEFEEGREILVSRDRCIVSHASRTIDFSNVNSFWYRKSDVHKIIYDLDKTNILNKTDAHRNINSEIGYLKNYIYYRLQKRSSNKTINKYDNASLNRFEVFDIANLVGLQTPDYIITNSKKNVVEFAKKHYKIALKPISNVKKLKTEDGNYLQYTTVLSRKQIKELPDNFFVSHFQQYIEKDFEVRAFYLNGKFYSMAILSQGNPLTEIDFRRYDLNNPNLRVPYKLPKNIERKLNAVFRKLKLNSGSVDLLHTSENKYFFLEINPVGQLGMVSFPCNYYLEKLIAETLIKYDKKAVEKN